MRFLAEPELLRFLLDLSLLPLPSRPPPPPPLQFRKLILSPKVLFVKHSKRALWSSRAVQAEEVYRPVQLLIELLLINTWQRRERGRKKLSYREGKSWRRFRCWGTLYEFFWKRICPKVVTLLLFED